MSNPMNNDPFVSGGEHGFIGKPVVNYTIVFEEEPELRRWQAYLRWLRKQYPDVRTIGQRIDRHISETVLKEGQAQ